MANIPYRRRVKIGRNDPCHCGSNKKFKHCHSKLEQTPQPPFGPALEAQIIEQGRIRFEKHKADELKRQRLQGLGRPIISTEHKGYRFVAVGSTLHHGKWKTFPDFLHDYIKGVLGPEWGNAEIAKPLQDRNPLLQWYDKICHLQATNAGVPGKVFSTPMTGAVSAYNRLAYNLYLIAHNGEDIQTRLVERLKSNDGFQGAFFETQVAAWLINAGFELEFEDEADRRTKHCEFTATHKDSGERYSVEAKSRSPDPQNTSRAKVGRSLAGALEKTADHKRLIFLDLNKPLHNEEAVNRAAERAERIVRQSENLIIDGSPAPAAYVCITNMNDQYVLDEQTVGTMIDFIGYKIHDFMGDEFPTLREAARARERHMPMFQLFKSMEQHRNIPQTFGGEFPSEVFPERPRQKLHVNEFYEVPGPDGATVRAKLIQAFVMNGKAHCNLLDPATERSWLMTFEMSPNELADYERYPETYFGDPNSAPQQSETAMDLFDFFVNSYRNTPREKLMELLASYPNPKELDAMSQLALVELLAENWTMNAVANGAKFKIARRKRDRNPQATTDNLDSTSLNSRAAQTETSDRLEPE